METQNVRTDLNIYIFCKEITIKFPVGHENIKLPLSWKTSSTAALTHHCWLTVEFSIPDFTVDLEAFERSLCKEKSKFTVSIFHILITKSNDWIYKFMFVGSHSVRMWHGNMKC